MATVTFAYDHSRDPMSPVQLADQILNTLALTSEPTVDISPTQIVVTHPAVTEANRTAIQSLINAYVYDPAWNNVAYGNLGALETRATKALTVNASFLALGSPTNAQVLAQVRALTRECNAIIRILTDAVDDLSNT